MPPLARASARPELTVGAAERTVRSRIAFDLMMVRLPVRALIAVCLVGASLALVASASAAQFSSISAGGTATCATKSSGQLFCWGDGRNGQLGRVSANASRIPVQVVGTYDSQQVSSGTDYACQILQRGTQLGVRGIFACWGGNGSGQLGDGREDRAQSPQEVKAPDGLTRIESGFATTCALGAGGSAYCWGDDTVGQLGDGSTQSFLRTPQQVPGVSGLTDLAIGDKHVCAVRSDGALVCWGWTPDGRLGLDVEARIVRPTVVPGMSDIVDVAAGTTHTCALRRDGTVWCFGLNDRGQIGTGAAPGGAVPTPTQVPGLSGITQIDAGALSTCAVGQGGAVWCWGDGHQGKLGNGSKADSPTPVQVSSISDVAQLSVGANHVCVLTSKGAPFCWGSNRFGQLGNGDRTGLGVSVSTPTRVVDYVLGRATFIPRVLQSFPTGTSGGAVELRNLVLRTTSTRFPCPKKATISITAKGRTARRTAVITRRSTGSCRVSGTFALPSGTDGAKRASYSLRATHVHTVARSLRAQRGS